VRIAYVEICGFRGFRDRARIEVPHGFLVVTGRNGSGKSTICDAVEFALTGTIGKYATEKGGKESLADYIWWRGESAVREPYVSVGFSDDVGPLIEVSRYREKVTIEKLRQLEDALCEPTSKPPDALQHLCQTSIIRDELIAATSLDLTDPARFEFVRSALGAIGQGDLLGKVRKAAAVAQVTLANAEKEAEISGSRMRITLAELADARTAASHATDIESAVSQLRALLGEQGNQVEQVLSAARQYVTRRRAAMQRVGALSERIGQLEKLRLQTSGADFEARRASAIAQHEAAKREHQILAEQLTQAEARLTRERETHSSAGSISALLEGGERLGLDHGHCPLCQTSRSEEQYSKALDSLRERLKSMSASLAEATARVAELRPKESEARANLQKATAETEDCDRLIKAMETQASEALAEWQALADDETELPDARTLLSRVAAEREKLVEAERNILVLEASQAIDRVSQLGALVNTIRADVDLVGNRVAAAQSAVQALEVAEKSVRRVNAEMVDERLASISPLLSELYYRLRPHQNWREIDYAIRGDVRRFLSLRVGDGLNPQFMFSSGQRRAAGLAFLLAVHLSRPWCKWRTVLLDDPVQHIDDFRALQLVEVLSALRKDTRQVICAIEDPALADVLCRRLRSTPESSGARLELEYDPAAGCRVVRQETIRPFPSTILQSAAS
jgi:chromosome segregation protein